jgi:hypothetical protein
MYIQKELPMAVTMYDLWSWMGDGGRCGKELRELFETNDTNVIIRLLGDQ